MPDPGGQPRSHAEALPLLYQRLLTVIVRMQSGRQEIVDPADFREGMKQALKEIEQQALARGFESANIAEANFAVVAFLDEAVLTSQDPDRTAWARLPLQEELFNETNAGEEFYRHIEALEARPDSPQLAQVMEIYLLCLLLGYEGRYAVGSKDGLHLLMEHLRKRIERIRGVSQRLSPHGCLPDEAPRERANPLLKRLRLVAAGLFILLIFCFIVFKLHLSSNANSINSFIQNSLTARQK